MLIAKGADADARDANGRTPLELVDEPALADALREAVAQGAEHVSPCTDARRGSPHVF